MDFWSSGSGITLVINADRLHILPGTAAEYFEAAAVIPAWLMALAITNLPATTSNGPGYRVRAAELRQ
jgi:hypothetical protein